MPGWGQRLEPSGKIPASGNQTGHLEAQVGASSPRPRLCYISQNTGPTLLLEDRGRVAGWSCGDMRKEAPGPRQTCSREGGTHRRSPELEQRPDPEAWAQTRHTWRSRSWTTPNPTGT